MDLRLDKAALPEHVRSSPRVRLLFLLLSYLLCGCTPLGVPTTRTILPADKAVLLYFLPDGRRIVYTAPSQPSIMLLDVATGQSVPVPENAGVLPLDDDLLYGEDSSTGIRYYYVVDLGPMVAIRLEPLPGGMEALPRYAREADSIYAMVTDSSLGKYMLLFLQHDPVGDVTQGYYVSGVRDLDALLSGIPYKTPPPSFSCPWNEKVPSPDGRYYYILYGGLRIYSHQGELLNTDSRKHLCCYGWAWDSSGVYVQERREGMIVSPQVGPLELFLAEP